MLSLYFLQVFYPPLLSFIMETRCGEAVVSIIEYPHLFSIWPFTLPTLALRISFKYASYVPEYKLNKDNLSLNLWLHFDTVHCCDILFAFAQIVFVLY